MKKELSLSLSLFYPRISLLARVAITKVLPVSRTTMPSAPTKLGHFDRVTASRAPCMSAFATLSWIEASLLCKDTEQEAHDPRQHNQQARRSRDESRERQGEEELPTQETTFYCQCLHAWSWLVAWWWARRF